MNRYKSACYLQRFLSVHDQIANQFMHCRYNRDAKRITQGASGQQDINWASVITSGNFAAGFAGLLSLPYKALYKLGTPIVSNIMQKIGDIIGLNASKSKFLVGKVPDANLGIKIDVATSRYNGGSHIDLNNTNVADVVDGAIIKLAGKELFQVPKALEKTPAEAATWYREQMGKLADMVDATAPLAEQLKQAEKLQELLVKSATHSLADPDQAAMFREAFARLDIEALATKFGGADGLSGKVLQEKILVELTAPVDKARKWFEPGACFAKGTLVHTKEGLKPIEQIQVGDRVLSKPENGGEQAYKRVLKTFGYPPERVVRVEYRIPTNKPDPYGANLGALNVTLNHPFWVKELGWTGVRELMNHGKAKVRFEDVDGVDIVFWEITRIYASEQPNVGWLPMHMGATDCFGALWNYDTHTLVNAEVLAVEAVQDTYRELGDREAIDPDLFFKAPVYNLEVEDFHTYYVGEHGIWVHNQNCGGRNFEVRNTPHALPSPEQCPASSVTSH